MDAGIDAKVFLDAPIPGVTCYGTGLAVACFTNFTPSGTVNLTAGTLDTDASGMCANNVKDNPPYCVIAAADISVTGTLAVNGTKPLVLLATGTITITGTLDVASHRTPVETLGAAHDFSGCAPGTLPTATKGGGGAGGSFGGTGGIGGDGPMAGTNGVPGALQAATALRGGCPGQDGDGNGGPPGHGGGAVYLIADTSISVGGAINASGEAGGAGLAPSPGGGGGAGAGGLIGLDSPVVTVGGSVFANGGGGAEGAGVNSNNGLNGNDPTVAGAPAANGGSSGGAGGAGGVNNSADGSAGATAASEGGMSGGGGGGSVGVIKLHRAATIGGGGAVSPPHS
jgi:hypothetical protein